MGVISAIQRVLSGVVRHLEDGFLFITLAVMVLLVFTQVIFRYILHLSGPYLEDLPRNLLIMFAFIGVAAVTRQKAHIRIDVMLLIIRNRRAQDIINLSLSYIWLVAVYLLIYINYEYMMHTWSQPNYMDTLRAIHMGWVKSFLFIGVVLWAGHSTAITVKDSVEFAKKYR